MRTSLGSALVVAAFAAGYLASHFTHDAQAQGSPPPLTPQIIDVGGMQDEQIGPLIPNTELRTRNLVVTEWGTVGVQAGNIFKHYHADANEVQFILEGAGTFWLGDKEVPIKAGDLIVIPKGTHHAGNKPNLGRFKALAIKLPPQRPDDTKRVD